MKRLSNIVSGRTIGRIRHYSGYIAEKIACIYLIIKGYKILQTRYRVKAGEIDIIALKASNLVFVEVKKRKAMPGYYFPVGREQEGRIVLASDKWLCSHQYYSRYTVRYDVIIVRGIFHIKHYKNYF